MIATQAVLLASPAAWALLAGFSFLASSAARALLAPRAVRLASLAAWALRPGFSFLASPAEGALLPRPLLSLLWIYPVVPLACTAAAWSAFRRHDLRRARLLTALPLAAALAVLAF